MYVSIKNLKITLMRINDNHRMRVEYMKIVFDIDGTLTNFEKFIIDHSSYLEKKYSLKLTNQKGYDVDGMFEIEKELKNSEFEDANKQCTIIKNDFWNKYYIQYLMSEFRNGVKETLNRLVNEDYNVIIVSSRNRACECNFAGIFVRISTIYRFKKENVKYNEIVFCPTDEDKIEYIKNLSPDIIVDDKPYILNSLSEKISCICISAGYNQEGLVGNVERKAGYENNEIYNLIEKIRKEKGIHNKSEFEYPNLKRSKKWFKLIKYFVSPILIFFYHPIFLHTENISIEEPLIYAPNHRSTLDPFFITYFSSDVIHWNALKRFFTGEDSIFNNRKNIFLRKFTAFIFKELGYIPVNRGGDNLEAIELTNYCLKHGSSVGIFAEGAANKNPYEHELLDIKSGLFYFAKDNHVKIQPISITWFPENIKVTNKIIVNYQEPFLMDTLTIEEGKRKWTESILSGINENKELINKTIHSNGQY